MSGLHSRAHFLVNGLLEVLRVDYGPDFARRVGRPVWRHYFHLALTGIDPEGKRKHVSNSQKRWVALLGGQLFPRCFTARQTLGTLTGQGHMFR